MLCSVLPNIRTEISAPDEFLSEINYRAVGSEHIVPRLPTGQAGNLFRGYGYKVNPRAVGTEHILVSPI